MSDKPFKVYGELIALLINRNIDIFAPNQKSFAKKALQHKGYYNLINRYSNLFLITTVPDDTYKLETTVDEIYSPYDFDGKLGNIIFKYILTNIKDTSLIKITYQF